MNQIAPTDSSPVGEAEGVISEDHEGRPVVTFTREFRHPIDEVWRAITDPKEAGFWLRGMVIDPRVGGKIGLRLPGDESDGDIPATGTITAYEPPRLIEFLLPTVNTKDQKVTHGLRWELTARNDHCVLRFANTFERGERASNSIICGWHHAMELFEAWDAGRPAAVDSLGRDRVVELYWHYRNRSR